MKKLIYLIIFLALVGCKTEPCYNIYPINVTVPPMVFNADTIKFTNCVLYGDVSEDAIKRFEELTGIKVFRDTATVWIDPKDSLHVIFN